MWVGIREQRLTGVSVLMRTLCAMAAGQAVEGVKGVGLQVSVPHTVA